MSRFILFNPRIYLLFILVLLLFISPGLTIAQGTASSIDVSDAHFVSTPNEGAYCRTPALDIPDNNPSGASDTLVIGNVGTLGDVNISINVSHTFVGDLRFILTHQETGTSVTFFDRPGFPDLAAGCEGANVNAILDDEAFTPVEDECDAGVPTIQGTFIPNNPLSAFDKDDLSGSWELNVSDLEGGDTGTLNEWCLEPVLAASLTIIKESTPQDGTDFLFSSDLPDGIYQDQWGDNGTGDGQFTYPAKVALDVAGNVYVADTNNHRVQKFDKNGNFLLKWGNNGNGDGQFNAPAALVTDSSGSIYVADTENHRIQKFDGNGNFELKWGGVGSGDGQFLYPTGLALDAAGNVYVADRNNDRIQIFTSNGDFLMAFGTGGTGDGQMDQPTGVAVDTAGNVFVADRNNNRIQKFNSNGDFVLKWGVNGSEDGQFAFLFDVQVDALGNVYVADTYNHRIQKFNSDGNFLAKWGGLGSGHQQFNFPGGIALDRVGYVYVADTWNHRIQKFSANTFFLDDANPDDSDNILNTHIFTGLPPGIYALNENMLDGWAMDNLTCNGGSWIEDLNSQTLSIILSSEADVTCTFSNTQTASLTIIKESMPTDGTNFLFTSDFPEGNYLGQWGVQGSGDGQFNNPRFLAADSVGNLYVSDTENHRIQKFDSNGNFQLKWGGFGSENGQFIYPAGVAVDAAGNVYVADSNNHRIQKFDNNGNFLFKWGSSGNGDGQFNSPAGVAVDANGNVFVADNYNSRIQKFDIEGNFLLQWGSDGSGDGLFYFPIVVAVDAAGNVYVADSNNHRIQKFDSDGNFLLKWGIQGSEDGQFEYPTGVMVDVAGDVYVTDSNNHRIQKFDGSGNFLLKWGIAGSGIGQFNSPFDMAVDAAGNLYVADSSNDRIQKFGASVFALDDAFSDDGDGVLDTKTLTRLLPGSYTLSEVLNDKWRLSDLTCDGGNWTSNVSTQTLLITLASGDDVTCTFVNSPSFIYLPIVIR